MLTIVQHRLRTIALASLLLGGGLASPAAFADQRVGVNSAVNPAATGIPPGGLPRRLVLGQDVVFNERITTEALGQTQILFVDESTMSVGPNANMVIDQFVYDPNSGTGKLAASLTRGVFRFVGGKLSKQDNAVTMRTPTATIGIRGGVMLVKLGPGCAAAASAAGCNALEVIFVYGKGVTITGLNGAAQTITRPGFEVTVSGPGASPSAPGPAPPGATAALLAQVDGRPGGHGGAPTVPTEVMVTNSGIANAISANVAASIQAAARTQPPAPQPQNASPVVQQAELNNQNVAIQGATANPVNGGPPVSVSQFLNPSAQPQTIVATPIVTPPVTRVVIPPMTPVVTPPVTPIVTPPVTPIVTPPVTPPIITPPVTPPVTIAGIAGGYYDTGSQGTARGFNGARAPYLGGQVVNGTFSASGSFGTGGAFGMVSFPLAAGGATLAASGAGTASPLGPVTGVTFLSPDKSFFFADLVPVHKPSQREFIYGGQPVGSAFNLASGPRVLAFAVVPDGALGSAIPFIRPGTGGSLSGASISPLILATPAGSTFSTGTGSTKALQASLAITGARGGQSSAIVVLVGNVTGSPAFLEGVIHGSYLASATGQPIAINSYYATPADGNGNSFYGSKTAISGFVLSPGAGAPNAIETDTANPKPPVTYQFTQPVVPVAAPTVANAAPTTQTLTGWFGGIMTKEPNGGGGSPLPYMLAGQTAISTFPSDLHITATLTGGDPATSKTSGIAASNGMVLQFGTTGLTGSRQAYINNNLFAVLESPDTPSTVNGVNVPFNNTFPSSTTSANTNPNIYLVTQTAAPATALLPNGLCTCQYLQWGYWGGEVDTPGSPGRVDVGHINSWVAGSPTTPLGAIVNLQAKGATGTYTGNLFGTVFNSGAQYLASGGLQASYNFGTGNGAFMVKNYDGLSFTATGNSKLSGPNYTFSVNKVPGLAGSISGTFYGPLATETGGNFAFRKTVGAPYSTSGIFAAAGSAPH